MTHWAEIISHFEINAQTNDYFDYFKQWDHLDRLRNWKNVKQNMWTSKETTFRNRTFFVGKPVFQSKFQALSDPPTY